MLCGSRRRMDKYTIIKRNTNIIGYFPFLFAAGVALDALALGTSFCELWKYIKICCERGRGRSGLLF